MTDFHTSATRIFDSYYMCCRDGPIVFDGGLLFAPIYAGRQTRKAAPALLQVDPNAWTLVDMSGNAQVMSDMATRLAGNQLTGAGTQVLRITGSGSGVSTNIGAGSVPRP